MATIEAITGDTITSGLRTWMDYNRVLNATDSEQEALEMAISRSLDNTVRDVRPVAGLLFPDYTRRQSVSDTEYTLYYDKVGERGATGGSGIEGVLAFGRDYGAQFGMTGDPERGGVPLRTPMQGTPLGTNPQAAALVQITQELQNELRPLQERLATLRDEIEDVNNSYTMTVEQQNEQVNALNMQRRELTSLMLDMIQQREGVIQQVIGDPSFTYQTFDASRYMNTQ